jgi:hypothetical protein
VDNDCRLDLLAEHAMALVPHPTVTVIYEDFSTGLHAKRLFDQVFSRKHPQTSYQLNMWKFNLLRVRALRAQAVQDAAAAAMVCIAGHSDEQWPPEITEWAKGWLGRRDAHPFALVLLLEGVEKAETRDIPALKLFRIAAVHAGLERLIYWVDEQTRNQDLDFFTPHARVEHAPTTPALRNKLATGRHR